MRHRKENRVCEDNTTQSNQLESSYRLDLEAIIVGTMFGHYLGEFAFERVL